ncbi:MAG: hypothetical protein R3A79_31305 [Nannocystaceae bacterium]
MAPRPKRLLLAALPALALAGACANRGAAGPTPIYSDTVQVGPADLAIDITHQAMGKRQLEIKMKMRVTGVDETEKLVADVFISGFNVEEGSTHWDGFVPPRQPQTHVVLLSIPEGTKEAAATVQIQRSHDSLLLVREELAFTVDDRGLVTPAN